MGCFAVCFGPWKHKQNMRKVQDQSLSPSQDAHEATALLAATAESLNEEEIDNPMKLVSKSKAESEEQMNLSNKKKVDFHHSNVETGTNEFMSSKDVESVENENGEVEKKIKRDKDDRLELEKKMKNPGNDEHQDLFVREKGVALNSREISSDDNLKGEIFGDCCPAQEESYDSLFSLSIDSRKHVYAADMGDKEVNSPLKPRQTTSMGSKKIAHISLNPSFKYDDDEKEKAKLEGNWMMPLSKESILKQTSDKLNSTRDVIAVDTTSLSSWLVESENSPESEKNYRDRSILGTMTAELKHLGEQQPSSGGSTPSCTVDNQKSIGTVGRYWQQTGVVAVQLVDLECKNN